MTQIPVGEFAFDAELRGDPTSPLVLMLHGFPQTRHSWRHQLRPLADAGYFVVAPDQRGYSAGARPSEPADYATERLVADALGMARAVGHEQFHVVGHDWGGQLAWLLAGRHPERVMSLTVLSRPHPAAFAQALKQDSGQADRSKHHRAFQNPATADLLLEDGARRLRRTLRDQGVPEQDADAYLQVLAHPQALEGALNWYRAASTLAIPQAERVSAHTLYIWGDQDASVGRVAAERSADYVDGPYQFVELEGVGHFVTDQAGARVAEILVEFLASI